MEGIVPARLHEGVPLLTMTNISSLEDLGPFFACICENVTRQQTKTKNRHRSKSPSLEQPQFGAEGARGGRQRSLEVIDAIIEKDFLEEVASD